MDLGARHRAAQRGLWRSLGEHTPGGSVVERPGGVMAAIVPARPERSIFNGAMYDDPNALLAARDELDAAYRAAGVHAWTVWVRPGDERIGAELERAGHVLDGRPMIMGAALGELDLEPRIELELDPAPTWETVARLNDAAYGIDPAQGFVDALGRWEDPLARAYVALVDGEPACGMGVRVEEGCVDVLFVATPPGLRGRGLASELMRRALRDARAEGAVTTVLEASALGEPVYARMGYCSCGRLSMYELRRDPRTL